MTAVLICVTPPTGEQLKGFEAFAARQNGGEAVKLDVVIDESLKSGFILRVGPTEYDRIIDGSYTVWMFKDGKWQCLEPEAAGYYELEHGQGYWIYQEPPQPEGE